jgi:hypothetical protein
MSIEIPGVDTKKGLALYDDDEDFYLIALRSWVKNTPAVLEKLRSVTPESLPDYVINVHGVKGTCAHIGAEELKEKASGLEIMAKAGDLDGILKINESFLEDADALHKEIKNWLENNDGD